MIKTAVIGAAGYVGGELLRLLLLHPEVKIVSVQSESQHGMRVSSIHRDLTGSTELKFSNSFSSDVDLIFLCSGHGMSKKFLDENAISPNTAIIDLSADFRIKSDSYDFVYGLCELNREDIKNSKHIANCGCFASCIQLGLLPLAEADLLSSDIHVTAITGSTGAGQKPTETTHTSWRNNNISIYKAFDHQHLAEINQTLRQSQGSFDRELNFIPMRGDFTRGIFASMYLKCDKDISYLKEIYSSFYQSSPFVHLSEYPVSVKDVVNTNNNLIYIEKHGAYLRIESVLDNLLKGAAGQAIQNMNIMFDLPEEAGLRLKASVF